MKSSGEMLFEAEIPPQPAPSASKASKPAVRNHFQFRFTGGTIGAVKGVATIISGRFGFILSSTVRLAIGCVLICTAARLHGATNPFAARAERAYVQAQHAVRTSPTNIQSLIQLARAAFDWAEFPHSDKSRAEIAQRGIEAARSAILLSPTNAAAHYWLGMDLGQLARTKSLGALKLVREMESEFHRARTLDPHTDYAGPDRSLGYLYRDAPSWPTSVGNRQKAREHLENAVKLHPAFPENILALAESFEKWADRYNLQRQLASVEQCVIAAREKFSGPDWEMTRRDWEKRLKQLQLKARGFGQGVISSDVP